MIKDRDQKEMAAKFCAAQGIVPFLEVVVRSSAALEDAPIDVTDVDVMGVQYGRRGVERRIIFDCKTGKMSAVNRALWASGLKTYVRASEAFLILRKDAPSSHRLVANELGIHIHSEANFKKFAVSTSPYFAYDSTYLADMNSWDAAALLTNKYPGLTDLAQVANTAAATEENGAKGVRSALGTFIKSAPELDPRKPEHLFIYANFLSAFAGFLTISAVEVKHVFQFDMEKDEFEKTLRYYIWGGKDSYVMRLNFRATMERAGAVGANVEIELPQWDKFIGMFRAFLDAPDALSELPFLAKELAFRAIAPGPRLEVDARLRSLFSTNNRARQFLFLLNSYLVAVGQLPREFKDTYESLVNSTVNPLASLEAPEEPFDLAGE